MALLKASLLALLAQADSPEYPLGPLRLPPIAEDAEPFRLTDLRYAFTDEGRTVSTFEARLRAGGSVFVGGEVSGDRRGLFFDTQRVELGVSEENGDYEIEGSLRAPWLLLATGVNYEDSEWAISGAASIRFSNDVELLASHFQDLDESVFTPAPVEEFALSGVLPPAGPPSREIRKTSLGVLYQRGSHLEALAEARLSRLRTEAGFDLDLERYRVGALWNPNRFELDGALLCESASGRLESQKLAASLGIDAEVSSHVLASASTLQRWEAGALRFEERYRFGATFFGRRHRFLRRTEAAARVGELQRRANALGYNERRVYDLEGLRRLRERLGVSPARVELKEELDELYRAEVRERNVPELGFELDIGEDAILAVERRGYRAFVGIPWPLRLPFLPSEEVVEFLLADFALRQEDYPGGLRAVSRALSVTAFLNRELSLAFRWEKPGIGPQEVILERSLPARFTLGFEYAMGR